MAERDILFQERKRVPENMQEIVAWAALICYEDVVDSIVIGAEDMDVDEATDLFELRDSLWRMAVGAKRIASDQSDGSIDEDAVANLISDMLTAVRGGDYKCPDPVQPDYKWGIQ